MIDIETEQLTLLTDTPFPGNPVASTMFRLATTGVLSVGGDRVILESVRCAGKRFCSREAVHRFIARCNGVGTSTPSRGTLRNIEKAEKACADLGV